MPGRERLAASMLPLQQRGGFPTPKMFDPSSARPNGRKRTCPALVHSDVEVGRIGETNGNSQCGSYNGQLGQQGSNGILSGAIGSEASRSALVAWPSGTARYPRHDAHLADYRMDPRLRGRRGDWMGGHRASSALEEETGRRARSGGSG
jgi:hypothetical protein